VYVWTGRGPYVHWQQSMATSKASHLSNSAGGKTKAAGIGRG
jgi:hypothetical protein